MLAHHTVQKVRSADMYACTHTVACNVNMPCIQTSIIMYVMYAHTCTHGLTKSHPAALQELEKKEGGDFPLTIVPSNRTAGDFKSVSIQANQG